MSLQKDGPHDVVDVVVPKVVVVVDDDVGSRYRTLPMPSPCMSLGAREHMFRGSWGT